LGNPDTEVQYLAVSAHVCGDIGPTTISTSPSRVVGEGGEIATFMFSHARWKAELETLLGFTPVHLTPVGMSWLA
jgi:hypothetical protein